MKKISILIFVYMWLLVGCTNKPIEDKEYTVSEGATKVIEAMTACPNQDLFSPDMLTPIGLDTDLSEHDKRKIQEANEEIVNNWEEAVGSYFADGYLEQFLETNLASAYLAESEIMGTEYRY